MKLENGWKLTELTQNLDSQFDETINAFANLLKAGAPQGVVGPRPPGEVSKEDPTARAVVRSTNVPIGYYEAIIGHGPCGEKQIYGWRYLGFAPYKHCPLAPCGIEQTPCEGLQLYGLIFENGIMTFKPLPDIEAQGVSGSRMVVRKAAKAEADQQEAAPANEGVLLGPGVRNAAGSAGNRR